MFGGFFLYSDKGGKTIEGNDKKSAAALQKLANEIHRSKFKEGDYIIYQNGDALELGKIKKLCADGAFVWYSCGETAAKTPYGNMHVLLNSYAITATNLGGGSFIL